MMNDKNAGKNLCLICGMCCNSTLFGHAVLQNYDEAESLAFTGQHILWEDGEWYFRFPCRALDGCACTIYDTRPTICRTYHCELLKKYEAGEKSWEEVSAIVADIKPRVDGVRQMLDEVFKHKAPLSLKQRYEGFLQQHGKGIDKPHFQKKHATLIQAYQAVMRLLDQHFFED